MGLVIGKFNKTVVVEQNTPVQQGAGWQDQWQTLLQTKGALKKRNGMRVLETGELYEDNNYDLWVRYQTLLAQNLSILRLRIKIDGREFRIHSIDAEDEKNFYYRFSLSEKKL